MFTKIVRSNQCSHRLPDNASKLTREASPYYLRLNPRHNNVSSSCSVLFSFFPDVCSPSIKNSRDCFFDYSLFKCVVKGGYTQLVIGHGILLWIDGGY